jgi:hypothetical protein
MILPTARLTVFLIAGAVMSYAQMSPIDRYLDHKEAKEIVAGFPRDVKRLMNLFPDRQSQRFAEYVASKNPSPPILENLRMQVERLRLNKLVGNTAGGTGTTALVSGVAVPGILGVSTEYGGILQGTNGNATTLRGNLLGLSRMVLGAEQFPYCPEMDQNNCQSSSRWLRRISGAVSFDSSANSGLTGTAATAENTMSLASGSSGKDFRMASWGVRFDLTANDPEDPKYVSAWRGAIHALRADQTALLLSKAAGDLFAGSELQVSEIYLNWRVEASEALKDVPPDQFKDSLERQLDLLILQLRAGDKKFNDKVTALGRSFLNYANVRDDLLREIQSHRASAEYTSRHPINQPSTSNLRFIYSHQPTDAPLLVTANIAATWYNTVPAGLGAGRFRDLQLSGQIDRRLGVIPSLGHAVLTLGFYYQWMKEDALITIGPEDTAPGSGIVLPGTAAKLLGTKGHIAVVQGKLTIPVSDTVKVPISVTWSNRSELIQERDVRGQVGLTLDIDSLFK